MRGERGLQRVQQRVMTEHVDCSSGVAQIHRNGIINYYRILPRGRGLFGVAGRASAMESVHPRSSSTTTKQEQGPLLVKEKQYPFVNPSFGMMVNVRYITRPSRSINIASRTQNLWPLDLYRIFSMYVEIDWRDCCCCMLGPTAAATTPAALLSHRAQRLL